MKKYSKVRPMLFWCAAASLAWPCLPVPGQEVPAPAREAKSGPISPAKVRPKYAELPPSPPDWEFVRQMAFTRFPDAKPDDVTRFITENYPLKMRQIKSQALVRPDDAVERLTDLIHESLGILALKEGQPRIYEMKMKQLKVENDIARWAEASKTAKTDERGKDVESLRKALEESFDLKQELMKSEVEQLDKKLQELKDLMQKRQENRKELVTHRLGELTGVAANTPKW